MKKSLYIIFSFLFASVCYAEQDDAIAEYRKAAEQGDAKAQFNLGFCYNVGQGVAQDYVEAVKWYCKAAEQGHANAQFFLGLCYYSGEGVEKKTIEAAKWFHKAAQQGVPEAQVALKELADKAGVPAMPNSCNKFCTGCGAKLDGKGKFCPECGTRL